MVLVAVLLPALGTASALLALLLYSSSGTFGFLAARRRHARPAEGTPQSPTTVERCNPAKSETVRPLGLTWTELSLRVTAAGEACSVLKACSGQVKPGQLCALVGPSGAGKTTLLDILAGHKSPSSGNVYVNEDNRLKDTDIRHSSVYVPQKDLFIPTLTLWETLWVSTYLRMPCSLPRKELFAAMLECISCMGLSWGALPGGLNVRGLSGGERRRLSVACATVAAPALIFLDECTSGLDSHAALVLMHQLKLLASRQHTIIGSIHQPRQAIWEMFDLVVVMSEGFCLYTGPAKEAGRWFTHTLGYQYMPNRDGSISDWILDVASVSFANDDGRTSVELLPGMQTCSDVQDAAAHFALSTAESVMESGDVASQPFMQGGQHFPKRSSWLRQYLILFWRTTMNDVRNPADVMARLLIAVDIGLLMGLVFLRETTAPGDRVQLLCCLFCLSLSILLLPFSHLSLHVAERHFFQLESKSQLYHTTAYYLAHSLASMPFSFVNGLLPTLVLYGLVGLQYSARAVLLTGVASGLLNLIAMQAMVLAVHVTPTQDIAAVAIIAYDALNLCLAGFLVPIRRLIPVLRGVSYIMPMRYHFALAATLQLEAQPCFGEGPAGAGPVACPSAAMVYDIRGSVGINIGALCIILAALHLASFAAIKQAAMTA